MSFASPFTCLTVCPCRISITQAQVMVNGKFRPQTFPLGLRESGERKLELTVDVGDPGDHAVQVSRRLVLDFPSFPFTLLLSASC